MNQAEPSNANTSVMLRLSVYGSLKRGFWKYHRFCWGVLTLEEGVVLGRLFETSSGIPVLEVPDGDILAVWTTNSSADVATQAHVTARMSNPKPTRRAPGKGQGRALGPRARGASCLRRPETSFAAIDRLEGFHPYLRATHRQAAVPAPTAVS